MKVLTYANVRRFFAKVIGSFESTNKKNAKVRLQKGQGGLYKRVCKWCKEHHLAPPPKSCFDKSKSVYITAFSEELSYGNLPFWYILFFEVEFRKEDGTTKKGKFPLYVQGNSHGDKFASLVPVYIPNIKRWVFTLEYRLPCGAFALNIVKGFYESSDKFTKLGALREVCEEAGVDKDDIKYDVISLPRVYENNGLSYNRLSVYLFLLKSIDTSQFKGSNEGEGKVTLLTTEEIDDLIDAGKIDDLQTIATFHMACNKLRKLNLL